MSFILLVVSSIAAAFIFIPRLKDTAERVLDGELKHYHLLPYVLGVVVTVLLYIWAYTMWSRQSSRISSQLPQAVSTDNAMKARSLCNSSLTPTSKIRQLRR